MTRVEKSQSKMMAVGTILGNTEEEWGRFMKLTVATRKRQAGDNS